MKSDRVYLVHMSECIRRVEANTADRALFFAEHTLQDAVLRNLQTMAEASQRVSDDLKTTTPSIEWRRIAAFRNVLVHDYLGVDLDQVWRVVEDELPELKRAVAEMLKRVPSD